MSPLSICRRALAGGVFAAAAAVAAAAQESPYQPPTFSYGEGRIGLLEAVRLTLAHDPNLLLDREDVRLRQGILQELSGQFDWTLSIAASYDYREQELRDSVRRVNIIGEIAADARRSTPAPPRHRQEVR